MEQSCWSQFVIWQVFSIHSDTAILINDSCDKIKPLSVSVRLLLQHFNAYHWFNFSHSSFAADIARSYLLSKQRDKQRICHRFKFHVCCSRNQNWIEEYVDVNWNRSFINSIQSVRRQTDVFIDSIRKQMNVFHSIDFVIRITKKNWQRRKVTVASA